ncbi:MAG: MBOAT family protein [Bacteroidales bacterium]|nr:MBOAT family protein [Bacteroidales bacterium]
MLFNSFEYLIFLPSVVVLYFTIPVKWRWLLLLIASYFFYMCWKAEYAILILFTTVVDYFLALKMGRESSGKKKKRWLVISILVNLGMLAGFKYLNFFSESVNALMQITNSGYSFPLYHILLPVGISFYIFQSLSYTIDVYRGIQPPEKHFGKFALYVSFFPQLVAGPIERSTSLLPQINAPCPFNQQNLISGLKLILWGFFKKLVIADRLGMFVSLVYENPTEYHGLPVILATVLFAFQLYTDFSGYTDIARGSARLLGYELMINFNRPLIATSLRDFWNRWHISLTTWFRDYLLYALPYIRNKKIVQSNVYRNLILTFLLMGLWHGAAWTFVLFGLFHGLMLVVESMAEKPLRRAGISGFLSRYPGFAATLGNLYMFTMLFFSLFLFRANSLNDSVLLLSNAFNFKNSAAYAGEILKNLEVMFGLLMIVVLLVAEHIHAKHNLIELISKRPLPVRWSLYIGFVFFVVLFGVLHQEKFIYFQF